MPRGVAKKKSSGAEQWGWLHNNVNVLNATEVYTQTELKWSILCYVYSTTLKKNSSDFPGGTVVKNPPVNAGDTGSSPGLGRSHMLRSN